MPFTGSSKLFLVGTLFEHLAFALSSESTWAKRFKTIFLSRLRQMDLANQKQMQQFYLNNFVIGDGGTTN